MNPLLEQFLQEARENLAFIDQNIENIGNGDAELLNSVFRAAHTLKGGSGIVGFEAVKELTHHAEDLLDMLRSGSLTFESSMIDALYNAFDEVMNLIEAAEDSEDVVEADEQTVLAIVESLNALMGKSNDSSDNSWEFSYAMMESGEFLASMPMAFLAALDPSKMPLSPVTLTEQTIEEEQLYVVELDIDPECMLFGNDPLYAISLLGDRVLGIHTCLSKENAKSILSGMDDPEGMKISSIMYLFVYAPFSEIEDALYNFIDDVNFYLPSLEDIMSVEHDEKFDDLAHELTMQTASKVEQKDVNGIQEAIDATKKLVANDSSFSVTLAHLELLLHFCDDANFSRIEQFFASLNADNASQTTSPLEATQVEDVPSQKADVSNELLTSVIEQQQIAIAHASSDEAYSHIVDVAIKLQPYTSLDVPQPAKESLQHYFTHFFDAQSSTVSETVELTSSEANEVPAEVPTETVVTPVEPKREETSSSKQPAQSKKVEKEVSKQGKVVGKTVKIEQESIDNLMNIVGELLVAKNSLPYLADSIHQLNNEMAKRAIMEKYTFINRLSEQLQDLIMSMRMLPISYVFDRYPKLVREISKDLNKKVSLNMEGGETKLDKNIIEMLADPMIHIMRNSLDHGIELLEVRRAKGKSEQGVISLHAYAQSDKIVIDIKDDGAGINVEKVMKKVIEKELMNIEQIEALSEMEKAQLVLLPGLSTADSISEYSGRGVGMDVVKKSIDSFGGTIHITTKQDVGTTIKLTIPVSLAVTSLLHVALNGVHYGFPMESVSETVKIEESQIEYLHNLPFVYIREEVIPLIFMENMLNAKELESKALPVVVLDVKGNRVAVVVNELLGQLDVVQKPLEGIMEHHPLFSGTALLGNGKIIMIYDPIGVVALQQEFSEEKKVG